MSAARILAGVHCVPLSHAQHRAQARRAEILASAPPYLRAWLASQPERVLASFERARAAAEPGLRGAELAEFERACGITREQPTTAPMRDEFGRLVIRQIPPAAWRRTKAGR